MCGIAGVLSREPSQHVDLTKTLSLLRHRGPDDQGVWHDPYMTMGHTRLSILDLSLKGHQPMSYHQKQFWITFNGEIYNYLELRKELVDLGHRFTSQTDTEVLLAAYCQWGEACLGKLRGMFAFGIWDSVRKILFLARDRCGEKPLYYHLTHQKLYFASELKALLSLLPRIPELNPETIDLYLHYQYVPEPQTPLRGVVKLPAAHYLRLDVNTWEQKIVRYWGLADIPPFEGDVTESLHRELEQAITLTLRSDVQVGIALSGGLDSSAIAILATSKYKESLHVCSVGYPGRPHHDERHHAQKLAQQLGLSYSDTELRTEDFANFFPDLVAAMDDPIADIAAYGHYAVMKIAAEHGIKVMLTGIGGDELFWGYPWVLQAVSLTERKQRLHRELPLPQQLWRVLAHLINHRAYRKFLKNQHLPNALRQFFQRGYAINTLTLCHPKQAIFYDMMPDFTYSAAIAHTLYSKDFIEQLPKRNPYRPFNFDEHNDVAMTPISICQMLFDTWLTSNCLALGDRVSMASSVETRLPLLDYKLIELVMGNRKTTPDHHLGHKYWFISALKGIIPDEILHRPKRGFEPPTRAWIDAIIQKYDRVLSAAYLIEQRVFHADVLKKFIQRAELFDQQAFMVYKILLLEIWYRKVVLHESLCV